MPVTRLLFVRHGQSEWNALGRWQGRADPPLSDLGRRQAAHAARALGTVDAIISSDLLRASESAEIIAEELGVGPVILDAELRERDAGEWSGLTRVEVEEQWPGYLEARRRPPGFESEESVLARTLAAIDRIRAAHPDGDVLVMCHGGIVYSLEQHLGAPWERLPNLGGRWVALDGSQLRLGDRVMLVDEEERTVPEQL